jgi:acetyl-CoA acetyltransferase family protein
MGEREVVFVEGMRTAFGKMGGALKDMTAEELGGIGIKGLIQKTKIHEKARVDSVFLGSAAHCTRALNPARWASLYAGLPYETSASFVEMQCGSGIDAINHAAWKILCNQADIIIAGGTESYSQQTVKFSMSIQPYKLIPPAPLVSQLSPVPEEASTNMGITAERLQVKYNIPRIESDRFAFRSQARARHAIEAGYFVDEIIPVTIPQGKKPPVVFKQDEHPRATSMEALSALPAVFEEGGTVTAGNASGRNDGSAFVLMMTRQKAKELGYQPMAKWLSGADYGCDPRIMGIAPGYAMPQAIKRAGLKVADMDVMECNEAFAVQNLAVIKEIENQTGEKVDLEEKWNPNGGAIAFGHPNGASGPRIGMFTMRELIRRGGRYGIYGSCCGGGLGVATVIENLRR